MNAELSTRWPNGDRSLSLSVFRRQPPPRDPCVRHQHGVVAQRPYQAAFAYAKTSRHKDRRASMTGYRPAEDARV